MGNSATATSLVDAQSAAFAAANLAESKKATGTVVLDLDQISLLADYFVITGGDSTPQVRAIVDAIEEGLSKLGWQARYIEGKREAGWILMDYGDVIVHVFQQKERSFYKLEQFWNQALIINRANWSR